MVDEKGDTIDEKSISFFLIYDDYENDIIKQYINNIMLTKPNAGENLKYMVSIAFAYTKSYDTFDQKLPILPFNSILIDPSVKNKDEKYHIYNLGSLCPDDCPTKVPGD